MQVYDEKYGQVPNRVNDWLMVKADGGFFNPYSKGLVWLASTDPRTSRFGLIPGLTFNNYNWDEAPPYANGSAFLNASEGIMTTQRADRSSGGTNYADQGNGSAPWYFPSTLGWNPGSPTVVTNDSGAMRLGLLTQNNPNAPSDDRKFETDNPVGSTAPQYYADADGVVRRAMAGQVPAGSVTDGANKLPADSLVGLPMATANSGGTTRTPQSDSRPMILNRPFRTTAELGYVFSGTPWENLSFSTPESGYASLLDVFCTSDTDDAAGLAAGRVDLNTRQAPVLQSILAGAYRDESNVGTVPNLVGGPASAAQKVAQLLVARTTGTAAGQGPLTNVSELVGKWVGPQAISGTTLLDGSQSYAGLSADLSTVFGTAGTSPNASDNNIQRFRESAIRPLAGVGTTRTWNLLIDLVAQTGRYPQAAATATAPFDKFVVEGETRFWLHVAIDRYTGRIIDKNLEIVKE